MSFTEFTTTARRIVFDSPLGADAFFVRHLDGHEAISQLFRFRLGLLSPDPAVDFEQLIGKPATIRTLLHSGAAACFNGIVSRFRQTGRDGALTRYDAEIVPSLWLLTREVDCRIFQGMTVPEIVKKVIKDSKVDIPLDPKIEGTYTPREFCVQYQESDYQFIARLMEDEGIFFFFRHEDGKHTLVLGDGPGHCPDCPEEAEFEMVPATDRVPGQDYVTRFELQRAIRSGAFAATDYNFKTPAEELQAVKPGADAPEVFEFPGGFETPDEGEGLAKIRQQELAWPRELVAGDGQCRALRSGHVFTLKAHERAAFNARYTLLEVSHSGSQSGELTAFSGEGGDFGYTVGFRALPADVPYRPPRRTPRPRILGVQPAVVTGKSGEEIWSDKYGRVKVKFFWDREGARDENSSCWIRCVYGVAGKSWGQVFVPRIGQEVMVAFIDGDPDQPLIVGGVYNDQQMPPYDLPGNQTKSTVKSRSSKGGAPSNFNELRFEDKKGTEEIYVQAEKDYNQLVKNDRSESIGHDRSLSVGHDKSEAVTNNKTVSVGVDHEESIGSNMSLTVGANRTQTVGANHAETIGGSKTLNVGGSHSESIGSTMTITVATMLTESVGVNYAETVGAAMELTIGALFTETVGAAKIQTIGAAKSVNVGGSHSVNVGGSQSVNVSSGDTLTVGGDRGEKVGGKLAINAGGAIGIATGADLSQTAKTDCTIKAKKVVVTADDEITLKAGSATITLKKSGDIAIEGNKISVKGSGEVKIKGSSVSSN